MKTYVDQTNVLKEVSTDPGICYCHQCLNLASYKPQFCVSCCCYQAFHGLARKTGRLSYFRPWGILKIIGGGGGGGVATPITHPLNPPLQ